MQAKDIMTSPVITVNRNTDIEEVCEIMNRRKIIFDIDYRPNLWGLAGHGAGDSRYIASTAVSDRLKTVLADCDLNRTGTGVEAHLGAGVTDVLDDLADQLGNVDQRVRRDFPQDQHQARRGGGLAGNARGRIPAEQCVQHCVRNLVAHLVRMTHRNGLRSKEQLGHRSLLALPGKYPAYHSCRKLAD